MREPHSCGRTTNGHLIELLVLICIGLCVAWSRIRIIPDQAMHSGALHCKTRLAVVGSVLHHVCCALLRVFVRGRVFRVVPLPKHSLLH